MIQETIYVVLCILTGVCGMNRRLGFWGTSIIALLVTPIPVLLVLALTGPSHRREEHWRRYWPRRTAPESD
jgi:hypothetical protein